MALPINLQSVTSNRKPNDIESNIVMNFKRDLYSYLRLDKRYQLLFFFSWYVLLFWLLS